MYFIVVLVIDAGPGLDSPSPHGEITITAKYSSKQHPKKPLINSTMMLIFPFSSTAVFD